MADSWPMAERRVTVSTQPRVDLFVTEIPGPPQQTLLVIHGGPDWDHSYLRRPLDELGGPRRVLMPDLRGCGRSTRGLGNDAYTPDLAVADLSRLLDQLAVDAVDVLGFSYGGLLAQRLVAAAPERVRRVVIASSSVVPVPRNGFAHWPERQRRAESVRDVWSDRTLRGGQLARTAAHAEATLNVWCDESIPEFHRRIDEIRFSTEWLGVLRAGRLPPATLPDAPALLNASAVEILLLHGRQDMMFPVELAAQAGARLSRSRVTLLDGAGHMAHIDQPAAWLDSVAEFLC